MNLNIHKVAVVKEQSDASLFRLHIAPQRRVVIDIYKAQIACRLAYAWIIHGASQKRKDIGFYVTHWGFPLYRQT